MENNDLTLERLAGLAKMVKALKDTDKPKTERGRISDFDMQFEIPAIKTIKAAIPYVDVKYQRELGVMVKLIEIDKLLGACRNVESTSTGIENGDMGMLKAIVPNLPKESRSMGEMLIRLLEIKKIAEGGPI